MTTILVADDEEGIVDVLSTTLEAEGHTILTATNGDEAFVILNEHQVDLVISDYMMPGLNGLELYFRMLEVPMLDNVPFILLSAFSEELSHAHNYTILPKPFAMEKLIDAVSAALLDRNNTIS